LAKKKDEKGQILDEVYLVADKIGEIRALIVQQNRLFFHELFTPSKSRGELIVTFLAVLELMKGAEIVVQRELDTNNIIILEVKEIIDG